MRVFVDDCPCPDDGQAVMMSIDWRVTVVVMVAVHADEWIERVEGYLRGTGFAGRAVLSRHDHVGNLDLHIHPVKIVSGLAL
jgi:hypothetical protein